MITETFMLKNREEEVTIIFDDDIAFPCRIIARNTRDQVVGEICIEYREDEGDRDTFVYHYITHLSMNKLGNYYRRQGIGTRMLELYRKNCVEEGVPFVAAIYDGLERNDGSHLTGDGLPFVEAMVARGILDSGGHSQDRLDYEMENEL